MDRPLITIGFHKGEMDFGVSCEVGILDFKTLEKLRSMVITAIWCAEDMWKRNNEPKAYQANTNKPSNKE